VWGLADLIYSSVPKATIRESSFQRGVMLIDLVDPAELIALSFMPPIVAGIFHVSAWAHYRQINREAPLTTDQRRTTKYVDWFVLGMGYLMVLSVAFDWPKLVWMLLCVVWAVSLAFVHEKLR
jgi:hypothetical protein